MPSSFYLISKILLNLPGTEELFKQFSHFLSLSLSRTVNGPAPNASHVPSQNQYGRPMPNQPGQYPQGNYPAPPSPHMQHYKPGGAGENLGSKTSEQNFLSTSNINDITY